MNETIFENLPRKMNLISDLFSRVVFRDKEACQDLVRIILGQCLSAYTNLFGQLILRKSMQFTQGYKVVFKHLVSPFPILIHTNR